MATNSKQIQTQALQQVQTLSPLQMLTVKLIELPTVELGERVRDELLDNPALEEGVSDASNTEKDNAADEEDFLGYTDDANTEYDAVADYRNDDEVPDYRLQEYKPTPTQQAEEIPFSAATSFFETLQEQINERNVTDQQREIITYLIGSLDDDGLLRKPLSTISEELLLYNNLDVSNEEMEGALHILQDFDPAGVGARNLQECLLLQLKRNRLQYPSQTEHLNLQIQIVSDYYDDFTHKNWDKIAQKIKVEESEVEQAIREICRLNPRPGASMGETIGRNMQQIVPDFIIENQENGNIQVSLNNPDLPTLRISKRFNDLAEEQSKRPQSQQSNEALTFLKSKIDAAQSFIEALQLRQKNMMSVMNTIVELQQAFFQEGDESLLKPMRMKDVAAITNLDVSTISRVASSKYAQTNYGIFPLRFFFSDSYSTQDGEEIYGREIKRVLQQMVDQEDKQSPYTDAQLLELLKEKGIKLARRTVSKYREQMGIPTAKMRREQLGKL